MIVVVATSAALPEEIGIERSNRARQMNAGHCARATEHIHSCFSIDENLFNRIL